MRRSELSPRQRLDYDNGWIAARTGTRVPAAWGLLPAAFRAGFEAGLPDAFAMANNVLAPMLHRLQHFTVEQATLRYLRESHDADVS